MGNGGTGTRDVTVTAVTLDGGGWLVPPTGRTVTAGAKYSSVVAVVTGTVTIMVVLCGGTSGAAFNGESFWETLRNSAENVVTDGDALLFVSSCAGVAAVVISDDLALGSWSPVNPELRTMIDTFPGGMVLVTVVVATGVPAVVEFVVVTAVTGMVVVVTVAVVVLPAVTTVVSVVTVGNRVVTESVASLDGVI